jgi:hypothetical protein
MLTNLSEPRAESHEQLISKAGWLKLDFEKEIMQTGSSETLLD